MSLDDLLMESSHVEGPDALTLARARAALPHQAVAVRTRRASRRMLTTRRLAITAGLAAAAAAVAVVLPSLNLGAGAPASASALEVLHRAAAAAAAQPTDAKDAQYWYSHSTFDDGSGVSRDRKIWIGHHQIGVLQSASVGGGNIPLDVAVFGIGDMTVDWDGLWSLPTDVDELYSLIQTHTVQWAQKEGDPQMQLREMFTVVGDLLRESPAPPALREALFGVVAKIPGVTAKGEVTDHAGRRGQAIARGDYTLIIDPSTGKLLEESAPGWQSTYLDQGPTDTAPKADPVKSKEEMVKEKQAGSTHAPIPAGAPANPGTAPRPKS